MKGGYDKIPYNNIYLLTEDHIDGRKIRRMEREPIELFLKTREGKLWKDRRINNNNNVDDLGDLLNEEGLGIVVPFKMEDLLKPDEIELGVLIEDIPDDDLEHRFNERIELINNGIKIGYEDQFRLIDNDIFNIEYRWLYYDINEVITGQEGRILINDEHFHGNEERDIFNRERNE